jgi:hypothetical protein
MQDADVNAVMVWGKVSFLPPLGMGTVNGFRLPPFISPGRRGTP